MRYFISILTSALIMVSTMHLSVASHYCHNNLVAVKISMTGKTAGCGMIKAKHPVSKIRVISSHCCDDHISVYSINDKYSPSQFSFISLKNKIVHLVSFDNAGVFNNLIHYPPFYTACAGPPGIISGTKSMLTMLCVFRN